MAVEVVRPSPRVLTPTDNARIAREFDDHEAAEVLDVIARRKDSIRVEMDRFAANCDRWDNLYYPNQFTKGGADHWPDDPNLKVPGKAHVSVNVHPTYVDVPAALQSVIPIENIVPPPGADEDTKFVATEVERLYFGWKDEVRFETATHKVVTTKSLYGKSAMKVMWDEEQGIPVISVIEQPRNLWLGWSNSDYTRLEWAVYVYRITPEQAIEEYGLDLRETTATDGRTYVYAIPPTARNVGSVDISSLSMRDWLVTEQSGLLEVHDFWYRLPAEAPTPRQRTRMDTWNAITVGNYLVKNQKHPEYGGRMPYVPVMNTFVPGIPEGRSDLMDVEPLLREKDERISAGGTMVNRLVGKQFWQLVGPEAPDRVPTGLRPEPDRVVAPGPGNRIEAITPWLPEFELEAYLSRIDRELQDVSGLNDLLRGLAPAQVLSSSKAINALVANYEARITLRRQLLYQWRIDVWNLVKEVWGAKNRNLKEAFDMASTLVVKAPSLTPRDDIEQATMALNLLNGKVWAQTRAMDATGVEDPEAEQDQIRKERTDAALFPADVQAQAALMATMQQIGMQQAQMQQAQQQMGTSPDEAANAEAAAMAAQREAAGRATPNGQPMMQGEGEQGVLPPEGLPSNVAGAPAGPGGGFSGQGDYNAVQQTMLLNGEVNNRTLLQQPLSPSDGELAAAEQAGEV